MSQRETSRWSIFYEFKKVFANSSLYKGRERRNCSVFLRSVLTCFLAVALFWILSPSCLVSSSKQTPWTQTRQLHLDCVTPHPTGFWELWGMNRNPHKGHLSLGAYRMPARSESHFMAMLHSVLMASLRGRHYCFFHVAYSWNSGSRYRASLRLHSELGAGLG